MKKLLIWVLILPVKIYQLIISPLLPPNCIYSPTCSNYFIQSLKTHGPIKGFIIGVLRIFRCSPLFKGGWDPIDEKSSLKDEIKKYKNFSRKEHK